MNLQLGVGDQTPPGADAKPQQGPAQTPRIRGTGAAPAELSTGNLRRSETPLVETEAPVPWVPVKPW